MIDAQTFVVFLAAAILVIAAPGPDIFYVLSGSLSAGGRLGTISALGIASGEVMHTILAVLGLAALLHASNAAFVVLKHLGACYLIYLGIRAIRERNAVALRKLGIASGWKVFGQGVLTNLFNPKAVMFYVTFLPQFVNPIHGHAQLQLIVLGIVFAVLDVIFLIGLAACAGRINLWLIRTPGNAPRIRLASGTLLVGLGVHLALTGKD